MTSKELRKLSRKDLLELLVQQGQENETLQAKVKELEALVQNRTVETEKAGSLAEATLALSGVFTAADEAVALYKENLRRYSEEQGKVYDEIVHDAEEKAAKIVAEAENESAKKVREANAYWYNFSREMDRFYRDYAGLKEELDKSVKTSD